MYSRDHKEESGAVLAEAALSMGVFLLVIFFIIYLTIWMWRIVSLDHALIRTARWATLGLSTPSMNRIDSVKFRLLENIRSTGLNPADYLLRICPLDNLSCTVDDLGNTNKVFVVSVTGNSSQLLWYGSLPVSSVALGRNQ